MFAPLLAIVALAFLFSSVSGRFTPLSLKTYLAANGGSQFTGAANSAVGTVVSMIGDYNNDGKQDFAISAPAMTVNSKTECGMVVIVLGNTITLSEVDLSSVASDHTMRRIVGAASGDKCGTSLGPAGDVNQDGFDDVLIGAPFADPTNKANAGAIYVIFGLASTSAYTDIILSSFTPSATTGFTIFGPAAGAKLGEGKLAMSPLGDMNGDSIDDYLISAPSLTYSSRASAGGVWMIYGKTTAPTNLDLNSLGTAGILFGGAASGGNFGNAIDCPGDFNGDGIQDILVGAYKEWGTGVAHMIYGSRTLASRNMGSISTYAVGTRFVTQKSGEELGTSVCGAGDINGDGWADVLIGATGADLNEYFPDAGIVYVVFGAATSRTSHITVSNPMAATEGFTISGMTINGNLGVALSRAGDLNHDGFNDFLVADKSVVYVIFGKTDFPVPFLSLRTYEDGIALFDNVAPGSLSGGFDIYGDNDPDILVGTPTFTTNSGSVTGAAYLVEGPIYPFSKAPTRRPTSRPTAKPTNKPIASPTFRPSRAPTLRPTLTPTLPPSEAPTNDPNAPSLTPTLTPTDSPSALPTLAPTRDPTAGPTLTPTAVPSVAQTVSPIANPTVDPTFGPTIVPSTPPTNAPAAASTFAPSSARPSMAPITAPDVVLGVEQVVLNLSGSDYDNQKAQCNQTIQHTVTDLIETGTPERVTDIIVEEEEEEGRVGNMRGLAVTTPSVILKYKITTNDPVLSASVLTALLKEKVQSGQMDTVFRSYARQFNVTGLGNCTFATPKVTHLNPTEDDESETSNVGLIVGVTVGGAIFLLLVGVCVGHWCRARKSGATVVAHN